MSRKMSGVTQQRPALQQVVTGLVGGMVGIGAVAWLTDSAGIPLLMAPFGATCVLLFAAPAAPLAQPRNVIGGHLIAALVGLLMLQWLGASPWAMALAVGVAIALMQLAQVVHPPAGANPLVIMMAGVSDYTFLLAPVLAGAVMLVVIALLINNLGAGRRWPVSWW